MLYAAITGKSWLKFGKHKGKVGVVGVGLLLVFGLPLIGVQVPFVSDYLASGSDGTITAPSVVTGGTGSAAGCPATGLTAVKGRILDPLATTTTYIAGDIQFKDLDAGLISDNQTTSASGDGYATATNLVCGHRYEAYVTTVRGNSHSGGKLSFTPTGASVPIEFSAADFSRISAKVKDIDANAFLYNFVNGSTGGVANSTNFQFLNDTNYYADAVATPTAVASGGSLNLEFHVKALTPLTDSTDPALKTYFSLDTGTANAWQVPVCSINGGNALTNVKGSMSPWELQSNIVAAAEVVYDLGTFVGQTTKIVSCTFTGNGNPGTSDDLIYHVLGQGMFKAQSTAHQNEVLVGVFDDSTSATPVLYEAGYVPKGTVQIS